MPSRLSHEFEVRPDDSMLPNHRSQRGVHARAHANTLTIATHNIRSGVNTISFLALLNEWRQMHLQVVCVQELHTSEGAAMQLLDIARSAGYNMLYALPQDGSTTAGVAILVDMRLLLSGQAKLHEDAAQQHPEGRMLSVPLDWGGHRLLLINCYVHNQAPAARAFLLEGLQPCLAETGG